MLQRKHLRGNNRLTQQEQTKETLQHCQNPFFACINTNPELHFAADIKINDARYPVCRECWNKIAESEEFQWENQWDTPVILSKPEKSIVNIKPLKKIKVL